MSEQVDCVMPADTRFVNLTGRRFGRLTVLAFAGRLGRRKRWLCECSCGTITQGIDGTSLKQGETKSCGCLRREGRTTNGEQRGGKPTSEYTSYTGAKARCNNPNATGFNNYGGRGIEFRFRSFDEFLAEVGRKPTLKHSIDRIDNDGHYEPGNVRWATAKDQQFNRRK